MERSAHELGRTRLCRVIGCEEDAADYGFCAEHLAQARAAARRVEPDLRSRPADRRRVSPLTRRHVEILSLIADGLCNRDIGKRLHLSEETVKTHIRRILSDLDARNRTHAVAIAFREGWLE